MTELEAAVAIATEAGASLLQHFRQATRLASKPKGDFDIVTEADWAASETMLEGLRRHFPDDSIVCEDAGGKASDNDRLWYVDPLDGTKNFAHGIGHFCTMLALEEGGSLRLAVIHDPVRGETFSAVRGLGSWVNGSPIVVSSLTGIRKALVASGFPSSKRHAHSDAAPFVRVSRAVQGLRRTGCSGLDLAYAACGRFGASWDWGLEVWDVAAGVLLVEQAGGVCSNWEGSAYRIGEPGLVAAAPQLHQALLAEIRGQDSP